MINVSELQSDCSDLSFEEIWGTMQMITVQSHRRHPFILFFQLEDCSLLNPFINTRTKPHWAFFLSNFPSLKSIDGLFVLLLYSKRECMKQICFVPTQSLAAFLILILLIFPCMLPFHSFSNRQVSSKSYFFFICSWYGADIFVLTSFGYDIKF